MKRGVRHATPMPISDQADTATNQNPTSPQRAIRNYRSYVQQRRALFILGGLALLIITTLAAVAWPRISVQSMHVTASECGDWTIYSRLDPGPFASLRTLGPIAAVNRDDLWILGSAQIYPGAREEQAIMFHWDGEKFTSMQGPADATAYEVIFNDVSVLNGKDVWAAGSAGLDSVNRRFLLVHWNGVQWERVEVPWTANGDTDVLTGVAALSPDNIWTVGWTATYPETHDSAVIHHWDGTQWTLVPGTDLNFGEEDVSLSAIKAISANNIWVVGQIGVKSARQTLVVHWDGTEWTRIATPNPCKGDHRLVDISGNGAEDIWAVGHCTDDTSGSLDSTRKALMMHWNGGSWELVQGPYSQVSQGLEAVGVIATDDVWAAGNEDIRRTHPEPRLGDYLLPARTLMMHWDGSSWSSIPSPNPANIQLLKSVAVSGRDEIWVAGTKRSEAQSEDISALVGRFSRAPCTTP